MSKVNLLFAIGVVGCVAGGGLLLTGAAGVGTPIPWIVLVVGLISLAGAYAVRRHAPGTSPERVEASDVTIEPGHTWTIAAVAGAALGVVALLLALVVGEGEARSHGVFHWLFGAVALGLLVAVDRWWRPRIGTFAASWRSPVLALLLAGAAAAFLESIGAAGYDRFNAGVRTEWLTTLHNASAPFGTLAVLMIPIAVGVLVSVTVRRMRTRRTAAEARTPS